MCQQEIDKENGRIGGMKNAIRQLAKTHCPKGHPYSGANLYVAPDGSRICRMCKKANDAERRLKNGKQLQSC